MRLRTLARDCLYLNWAFPRRFAPVLPAPLRYEEHAHAGEDFVFVSVLLFRLTELHLTAVPGLRLAYPQANVRLYVRDGSDQPAVFYLRTLVPLWVVPGARWFSHLPVEAARLRYPRPSRDRDEGAWRWQVGAVGRANTLTVRAQLGSPPMATGPRLGPWDRAVAYFRQRPHGYVLDGGRVRAVDPANASVDVWPLVAEVEQAGLMAGTLPEVETGTWGELHSAWLCPEIPFRFELGRMAERALGRSIRPAAEGA